MSKVIGQSLQGYLLEGAPQRRKITLGKAELQDLGL